MSLERKIICLEPEGESTKKFIENTDKLAQLFNEDWILDPMFGAKIVKTEHALVYHLIKYTAEELDAIQAEPQELDVQSVKSVTYEEVDALIAEGYKPKDYYAKNVIMLKMKGWEVTK